MSDGPQTPIEWAEHNLAHLEWSIMTAFEELVERSPFLAAKFLAEATHKLKRRERDMTAALKDSEHAAA